MAGPRPAAAHRSCAAVHNTAGILLRSGSANLELPGCSEAGTDWSAEPHPPFPVPQWAGAAASIPEWQTGNTFFPIHAFKYSHFNIPKWRCHSDFVGGKEAII